MDKEIDCLTQQIEIKLKSTTYCLQSIELAFGTEGDTDTEPIVHSKIPPKVDSLSPPLGISGATYSGRMDNYGIARGAANRISAMLVGSVYEILIQDDLKYWNKYNLYEDRRMKFLQQVRHGVFHSNRFKLDDYEGGAEWRGVEITHDMAGEVVFTETDWANDRLIRAPELPEGHWYSEEDTNEGVLCAGDGLELVETVLEILRGK